MIHYLNVGHKFIFGCLSANALRFRRLWQLRDIQRYWSPKEFPPSAFRWRIIFSPCCCRRIGGNPMGGGVDGMLCAVRVAGLTKPFSWPTFPASSAASSISYPMNEVSDSPPPAHESYSLICSSDLVVNAQLWLRRPTYLSISRNWNCSLELRHSDWIPQKCMHTVRFKSGVSPPIMAHEVGQG